MSAESFIVSLMIDTTTAMGFSAATLVRCFHLTQEIRHNVETRCCYSYAYLTRDLLEKRSITHELSHYSVVQWECR